MGITVDKMAARRWLKPRIVVTIDFLEWTLDDRLRHAAIVGTGVDKAATSVHRDR